MHIMGSVRLMLANGLRVVHIALWLTIPTVFWLWLVGLSRLLTAVYTRIWTWYQENVLCESLFSPSFGSLLVCSCWATIVIACWIMATVLTSSAEFYVATSKLPLLSHDVGVEGCGLFCMSPLRYWLPAIAVISL